MLILRTIRKYYLCNSYFHSVVLKLLGHNKSMIHFVCFTLIFFFQLFCLRADLATERKQKTQNMH